MSGYEGTGTLVRLALRRDRIMMPVWLLIFVATAAGSAGATVSLYPTEQARAAAAQTSNASPALIALYGRIYDPTNPGGIAMLKMTSLGALFVGVLMVITVVRHSRAEEESGRLELLSAGVVGRRAPLTAALIVAGGSSVALGVLTALGLIGAGLPAVGSIAFGLAWACTGIAFAAVAAITAQLTESTRAATGTAITVLGAAYVVRAVSDAGNGLHWLAWLSPMGWVAQIRPFGGNRWWVALIIVAFAVLAVGAAYAVRAGRDLGAGVLRPRLGHARAGVTLRSPLALAWRLQRGSLYGWLAGFVILGFIMGGVASGVGGLIDTPAAKDLITKLGGVSDLTNAFLATEIGMLGVVAAAYGIQAASRLRAEETALRAEPLLAGAVTRPRLLVSHIVIALVGTTVLMVGFGLASGLSYGASTGRIGHAVGQMLGAGIAQLPAIWVLTAIVVALFGLAPRFVVGGWVALVVFLILGQFGDVLGLNKAVMNVSPFAHTPRLPGGEFSAAPVLWLCVVAIALGIAGFVGFRRRDVG
ncbi:ABC-2 type transport system permease protein [Antricoccus suffuscus]|uniref:ABC-2 type transport system permease protein n=1 Tax=Antricoccus suffuscus TaxID=1629062 RepID=A0A2T0ZZ70_9ACTN|nr:ABC transporter permease [Antricoccus suffuscus]PRZ41659.1 ABC-2 type transport system permease protein [Antricoccus suffuscus]